MKQGLGTEASPPASGPGPHPRWGDQDGRATRYVRASLAGPALRRPAARRRRRRRQPLGNRAACECTRRSPAGVAALPRRPGRHRYSPWRPRCWGPGGGRGADRPGPAQAAVGTLAVLLCPATAVDALFDDLAVGTYLHLAATARLRHRLVQDAMALGGARSAAVPTADLLSRLAVKRRRPGQSVPLLVSAASTALTAAGGVAGWR
ncbi:hypothetical protein HBB16_05150 [Pseudonocardia sp. MCCB 268]|nr:hypothetical protein [Pseudonocardia cytotoxica]